MTVFESLENLKKVARNDEERAALQRYTAHMFRLVMREEIEAEDAEEDLSTLIEEAGNDPERLLELLQVGKD